MSVLKCADTRRAVEWSPPGQEHGYGVVGRYFGNLPDLDGGGLRFRNGDSESGRGRAFFSSLAGAFISSLEKFRENKRRICDESESHVSW